MGAAGPKRSFLGLLASPEPAVVANSSVSPILSTAPVTSLKATFVLLKLKTSEGPLEKPPITPEEEPATSQRSLAVPINLTVTRSDNASALATTLITLCPVPRSSFGTVLAGS